MFFSSASPFESPPLIPVSGSERDMAVLLKLCSLTPSPVRDGVLKVEACSVAGAATGAVSWYFQQLYLLLAMLSDVHEMRSGACSDEQVMAHLRTWCDSAREAFARASSDEGQRLLALTFACLEPFSALADKWPFWVRRLRTMATESSVEALP